MGKSKNTLLPFSFFSENAKVISMKSVYIENKEEYNKFLADKKHASFLQSFEWGEFQKQAGNQIFRIGLKENNQLIGAATLIKKDLPMNKIYFYCPRELKIENQNPESRIFLFSEIEKIAKKEKAIFFRLEPDFNPEVLKTEFQIRKTKDIQPSRTLILDLREKDLLGKMHQKTRYNIRLAEKKGVKITEGEVENFDDFWKIMEETVKRDGFRLHAKEYYRKMLLCCGESDYKDRRNLSIKLFLAEYEGKIIAANIVSFFGDTVTYVHGASSNEHRNVMASYALQWHLIKLAKDLGYKYYDFYGIDEKKWPGVTRFKKGFGGKEINYPGTFDLIFKKWDYYIYKTLRRIRRMF